MKTLASRQLLVSSRITLGTGVDTHCSSFCHLMRGEVRVFAELDGVMELFNTVDALFKHIDPELYEEYALVTRKSFLMSAA